jgi:hypothetical protein
MSPLAPLLPLTLRLLSTHPQASGAANSGEER